MDRRDGVAGRLVLVVCNVAGMIDLVALPLWVGVLMQSRSLGPQAAGMTLTCYVLGVFASSVALARRFDRVTGRAAACAGFAVGAVAFLALTATHEIAATAALHLVAGLGAGCGLSFTHGTIARTANPHRMFAMAGLGLGVFAIAFFAFAPGIIAAHGADGLFTVLGALLAVAACAALAAFPRAGTPARLSLLGTSSPYAGARLAFAGVACFATTQSMVFSFVERIGLERGFTAGQVGVMLLIGGFANVTAPLLASLLERRVSAFAVSTLAIPLHGILGALVTVTASYVPWAAVAIAFVWVILFGHNFIFGLIAAVDPSGRTAASTPAMLMVGAAIGPALGGVLAEHFGFSSLGAAALAVAAAGTLCLAAVWRLSRAAPVAVPA